MPNRKSTTKAETASAKSLRLWWSATPHIRAGLIRLQRLGVFGDTRTKIVNHILGEELRRLLETGLLTREELREALDSLTGDADSGEPEDED